MSPSTGVAIEGADDVDLEVGDLFVDDRTGDEYELVYLDEPSGMVLLKYTGDSDDFTGRMHSSHRMPQFAAEVSGGRWKSPSVYEAEQDHTND